MNESKDPESTRDTREILGKVSEDRDSIKAEHGPLPPGLDNLAQGTDSGKSHTRIPR